ncbi:MAG: exopolyphosphatase [Gammaproteobacteria bacterium]|nr:MAG: exopolyphosphatase [Gammaproteobacteria bacterium]
MDGLTLPEVVAAIDLGSNSFHMVVARLDDGRIQVLDRIKEMVRLRGGLDEDGNLDPEVWQRAIDCLSRFGQRVSSIPRGGVRAVGTNTLRNMRQSDAFLREAEQALGHPVSIIAGQEEARLIYLGVAHSLAEPGGRRLVVDIGGGSTEAIIGEQFSPSRKESMEMGCVSMSQRFFPDGKYSKKRWKKAELAARLEVKPFQDEYDQTSWDMAVGSSGSIRAAAAVIQELGYCQFGITREGLEGIRDRVLKAGSEKALKLPGLADERKPVFAGGVVILLALFKTLGIERMLVSDGSLREGLLYELAGRLDQEDIHEITVRNLQQRFGIRDKQADRVAAMAQGLYRQVKDAFAQNEDAETLLNWAARLHEIGFFISHSGYHRHGAYLLENMDMPGFSRREQRILATLVGAQRKKLGSQRFELIPEFLKDEIKLLAILLRLAILLHRDRTDENNPLPRLTLKGKILKLRFPAGWLQQHPLTDADLCNEKALLKQAGFKLKIRSLEKATAPAI